jgi:hypothetical protein
MHVRLIKMRKHGVEIDRRAIAQTHGVEGLLVVRDVTDQGLRRPTKVARLLQEGEIRSELNDVHIVWCNDGRLTLSGFERLRNAEGKLVDYCQSWLCILSDASSGLKTHV